MGPWIKLGVSHVLACSLEGYMSIMDQSAKWLVAEMGWSVEKGNFDVQQPIQDMTLNVVGRSAFG